MDEVYEFYEMIMANKLTNCGPNGTCIEYKTSSSSSGQDRYIQTSRTINGRKIHARVHRVALLKKIRQVELPDSMEASHLCHNKKCMNIDHLIAEPHDINMSRYTCAYMRTSTGDNSYCTNDHASYENCL